MTPYISVNLVEFLYFFHFYMFSYFTAGSVHGTTNWQHSLTLAPLVMFLHSEHSRRCPVSDVPFKHFMEIKKDDSFESSFNQTGNVLLSQAASHQVSSALRSLTSVFEMGTGVTSSLLSPDFHAPSKLNIYRILTFLKPLVKFSTY